MVSDARAMVSDIHRTVVKDQEWNAGEDPSVGDTRTASTSITC